MGDDPGPGDGVSFLTSGKDGEGVYLAFAPGHMSHPSLLVIHPGALGDVLLALPALRSLRVRWPDAAITAAGTLRVLALFEGTPYADRITSLEDLAIDQLFSEMSEGVCRAHPAARFDLVISWFGSSNPTYRTNLARVARSHILGSPTPPEGIGLHVSRHLQEMLMPLGIPILSGASLPAPQQERQTVDSLLASWNVEVPEQRLVALHPGGGSPKKCWPAEGFAALGEFCRGLGVQPFLIEGPADSEAVRAVASRLHSPVPIATGLGLRPLAALLARCRLFVGNDSGLTHLSAALGTSTLAIFGPTEWAVWAPLGPHAMVVAPEAGDPWPHTTTVLSACRDILKAQGGCEGITKD